MILMIVWILCLLLSLKYFSISANFLWWHMGYLVQLILLVKMKKTVVTDPSHVFSLWSALSQKPAVTISPLIEGQRATLTCMTPAHCSRSDPIITWKWKGRGKEDYIADNITSVTTEFENGVTRKHVSMLMFQAAVSQHFTNVTCKVSFNNNISTEETVTLNINCEYSS